MSESFDINDFDLTYFSYEETDNNIPDNSIITKFCSCASLINKNYRNLNNTIKTDKDIVKYLKENTTNIDLFLLKRIIDIFPNLSVENIIKVYNNFKEDESITINRVLSINTNIEYDKELEWFVNNKL